MDIMHLLYCLLQDSINKAFDAVNMYADTFEPFREFYRENESLDLEAIKEQDHGQ